MFERPKSANSLIPATTPFPPLPVPYLITTNFRTSCIYATTRREAILAALELHGPGARIVRVEIAPEWS